jgi:hypothetical protein
MDISHGSRKINSGALDRTLGRHGVECQLRLIWCSGAQYVIFGPCFSAALRVSFHGKVRQSGLALR